MNNYSAKRLLDMENNWGRASYNVAKVVLDELDGLSTFSTESVELALKKGKKTAENNVCYKSAIGSLAIYWERGSSMVSCMSGSDKKYCEKATRDHGK